MIAFSFLLTISTVLGYPAKSGGERPQSCTGNTQACAGWNQDQGSAQCCSGYCHVMDVNKHTGFMTGICEEQCFLNGQGCKGHGQYQADAQCCSGHCNVLSVDGAGVFFGHCAAKLADENDESSGPNPINTLASSSDQKNPTAPTSSFEYIGEGECRQYNGQYALEFDTVFTDLMPWTNGDNKQRATDRCQSVCSKYSWCYAANVMLRDEWPHCTLITDKPTFEAVYGSDQDYSWGATKYIDGTEYMTYCAGDPEACNHGGASNWGGGVLGPRKGYFCYKNLNTQPSPSPTYPADFEFMGEGECRQSNGEYGLQYDDAYSFLNPWTANGNAQSATDRCKELCAKYSWCYAANVVLIDYWSTPHCTLITDKPTFEAVNGDKQDYSWGATKYIDGVPYQTYCSGNCTKWGGGKLNPRKGYYCYKKLSTQKDSMLRTKNPDGHLPAPSVPRPGSSNHDNNDLDDCGRIGCPPRPGSLQRLSAGNK